MKFLDNDNNFRPLIILHDCYNYKAFMPYKTCVKRAKKTIETIKALGYGGVVTNVYCGKKGRLYLKSKKLFKVLAETIKFCKEQDLSVWIYDECGYPSGSAVGKVVKQYPDAEAFGVACIDYNLKSGETVTAKLPYNHIAFKSAFFKTKDGVEELSHLANTNGDLTYTATGDGKLYYFATKTLFEGVHASRKFAASARYIDVLDKKAVSRFVQITHEQYKKYMGDALNCVEAVFTDEPSVMSIYMPILPRKKCNIDKPNEKMPLYKFVAWSRNFEEEFKNRKGYDISPYIYMLFEGDSDETAKVRIDYNEVCAELYKEAFFDGIAGWCDENNLKLTGHLLGEENLYEQVYNEYDNFKMLKSMHYPGIDVLTCNPKTLLEEPLLLKTTSSAAYFHNKKVVMSETGFHLDSLAKIKPDKERILASIILQYAKGINKITSYLGSKSFTQEEYKYIFDRVSKAGQMLNGGEFVIPMLVYYPSKSCYKFITPSEKDRDNRSYDENLMLIDNSIKNALLCLDENKLDYYLIDNENLMCLNSDSPFKAIYFSACDFKTENITEKVIELANKGILVYVEESRFVPKDIIEHSNILMVPNAAAATKDIYNKGINDIVVSENEKNDIAFCHKKFDNKDLYIFINTVDKTLDAKVMFKENKNPYIYNLNKCKKVSFKTETGENSTVLNLKLQPFEVIFIIF